MKSTCDALSTPIILSHSHIAKIIWGMTDRGPRKQGEQVGGCRKGQRRTLSSTVGMGGRGVRGTLLGVECGE